MEKIKFNIQGMSCSACSTHIEKAIGSLQGVQSVYVSLLTNSMTVSFNAPQTTETLIDAVHKAGYSASVTSNANTKTQVNKPRAEESTQGSELAAMQNRLIISFVFLVPLMYISMGSMLGFPIPSFLSGHANSVSYALSQ
ncbi:MAG: cation transporter, partial [Oscillospiraceae bacterium]